MHIKTPTIVAGLLALTMSFAVAQTPPTTGGQSPYPNNAGAAQEPGPGAGKSAATKSMHHKKMAKHPKSSKSGT